ncbi:hypothetical protein [Absidia glauca]|uniref:ribonuclease Z n=1 Tax=Absidia glauca TaxID=4829 RepID=A0A163JE14_ABSGL|nr:hypothetical protein [Absidia glauca]
MATYLRFLGHTTSEGPPAILFHHNNDQYMFNCPEGTQRLAVEDKIRISKLDNIFFTRMEWECTGGMPGMLLTLADSGLRHINLHGGKNLTHFMASTRFFMYRTSTTVHVNEFIKESPDNIASLSYELMHKSLKVTPVVVLPTRHRSPTAQDSSSSDYAPSDDPYTPSKSTGTLYSTEAEARAHRRQVISYMFSDEGNGKPPGGTGVNAPCTPRQHPLGNREKSPRPATEAAEAIVDIYKKGDNNKAQAKVTSLKQHGNVYQASPMMELYQKNLPKTTPSKSAISYICQAPDIPGKFLPDKAMSLGVPKGALFGKLQRGGSVTLEDGTVVTHTQVCEKTTPGSIFIVVDCPNVGYIDELISSPQFNDYQSLSNTQKIPKVIIHLLGDNVLDSPNYRKWMNSFSPDTEHVISSEDLCAQSTLYRSHAISQYKLSKLNPDIFKIPEYNNTPSVALSKYDDLPPKVSPLMNKATFNLQETRRSKIDGQTLDPTPAFDTNRPFDDPKMKEFDNNKECQKAINKAKAAADQVKLGGAFPGDDVQVITLGTGSSLPSKYRNVSATLIKIPKFGSIMLDAGEGTYGQMLRYFGRDQVDTELKNLRCIFLSHLHADHHLGIFQLLLKRKKFKYHPNALPLYIIAPQEYMRVMKEYNGVEHLGGLSQVVFIGASFMANGRRPMPKSKAETNLNRLEQLLGLSRIDVVDVDHCKYAYGVSFVHKTGWKLVPCDRLIEAGKHATLLIHEATLEDDMKAEAIIKKHSTTAEAVEVGENQRYAKVPALSESQANVCISFDMMGVSIKQIPLLPKYNPAMQLMFKDDENDEKEAVDATTTDKRARKAEQKEKKKRKLDNADEQMTV